MLVLFSFNANSQSIFESIDKPIFTKVKTEEKMFDNTRKIKMSLLKNANNTIIQSYYFVKERQEAVELCIDLKENYFRNGYKYLHNQEENVVTVYDNRYVMKLNKSFDEEYGDCYQILITYNLKQEDGIKKPLIIY